MRIASLPERIRGYGHVREAHVETVAAEREALWAAFTGTEAPAPVAAAQGRAVATH